MPNAVGMPYQMRSYCDDLLGRAVPCQGDGDRLAERPFLKVERNRRRQQTLDEWIGMWRDYEKNGKDNQKSEKSRLFRGW